MRIGVVQSALSGEKTWTGKNHECQHLAAFSTGSPTFFTCLIAGSLISKVRRLPRTNGPTQKPTTTASRCRQRRSYVLAAVASDWNDVPFTFSDSETIAVRRRR